MDREYPMRGDAKVAFYVAGGFFFLLFFLVLPVFVGLFVIARTRKAAVVLSADSVVVKGLDTTVIDLTDAVRLGICMVPVRGRGLGGALARHKVGGRQGINVCVMNRAGKTRKFLASTYENHEDLLARISERVGKPYEDVPIGTFGVRWAEPRA